MGGIGMDKLIKKTDQTQTDLIEIFRKHLMIFVCNIVSYLPENYTELYLISTYIL